MMSQRDEFAKAAMQAIISAHAGFKNDPNLKWLVFDANYDNLNNNFRNIAEAAYRVADAMVTAGKSDVPQF